MAVAEERRRSAVLTRVGQVRRRLNTEVWLTAMVAPVWVGATLWAITRLFVPVGLELISVGLLVAVASATLARGSVRRVTLSQAAVVADRQAGAGGLLLTHLEMAIGDWEPSLDEHVKALPMPKVAWWRSGRWLLMAALFGIAGALMPRAHPATKTTNMAAASRVERLADQVEALAKEQVVPEDLEAELSRLQSELDHSRFDATDWEAADSLQGALTEHAMQASGALASAEQAAATLSKQLGEGELSAQKRAALEEQLRQLITESQGQTTAQARAAAATGDHLPSAESLRQALQKRREGLSASFGQDPGSLASSKPTSRGASPKGEREGSGQAEARDNERHASQGATKGTGAGHGFAPPAQLIFGGETDLDPRRLKFEPLPQGNGGDEPAELIGLRAVNPRVSPGGVPSASTGQAAAGAQAAGLREGALLPRNRAVIERYFGSK